MRLTLPCMACFAENGKSDDALYRAELRDPWWFQIRCRNGHESAVVLQAERFEVMAELATNAIMDGYYREAVSSFMASFERACEFYLRVVAEAGGTTPESFGEVWKEMSNQSERQLGAYLGVYLLQHNSKAPILNRKRLEFRNKVIHKGEIPTREDAIDFGNAVLDVVSPLISALRRRYPETLNHMASRNVRELYSKVPDGMKVSTCSWPTIFSLVTADEKHPSVDERVRMLESRRWDKIAVG